MVLGGGQRQGECWTRARAGRTGFPETRAEWAVVNLVGPAGEPFADLRSPGLLAGEVSQGHLHAPPHSYLHSASTLVLECLASLWVLREPIPGQG